MTGIGAILKRSVLGITLLFLLALPALAASRGEIVVICDREVAPYRALLEGFERECASSVRVVAPAEAGRGDYEERLLQEGVRAVVAVGVQAQAAVERFRRLRVLLTMAPQAERWVAAQPNRFGVEMALSPRRHLETLRRVFPRAKRIGVLFDPGQTGGYLREAEVPAAELGLELVTREVARPADLPRRLDELRGRVDLLWLLPDPTVLQGESLDTLLLASFESRLPLYGFSRKYAELGAVAAAHVDPGALGAQAAALLPDCLAALPASSAARWQYATGAQLVVNQKIARKLGLDLAPALLEEADDVLR